MFEAKRNYYKPEEGYMSGEIPLKRNIVHFLTAPFDRTGTRKILHSKSTWDYIFTESETHDEAYVVPGNFLVAWTAEYGSSIKVDSYLWSRYHLIFDSDGAWVDNFVNILQATQGVLAARRSDSGAQEESAINKSESEVSAAEIRDIKQAMAPLSGKHPLLDSKLPGSMLILSRLIKICTSI